MKFDEEILQKRIKTLENSYNTLLNDPFGGEDFAKPQKQIIDWLKELQQRRAQDEK